MFLDLAKIKSILKIFNSYPAEYRLMLSRDVGRVGQNKGIIKEGYNSVYNRHAAIYVISRMGKKNG